ncbi:MAG: hypothetical protein IJM59_10890 [Proteobacteria bacterium]|nr:hypothetical protein [Pseudomonadota bacterium]
MKHSIILLLAVSVMICGCTKKTQNEQNKSPEQTPAASAAPADTPKAPDAPAIPDAPQTNDPDANRLGWAKIVKDGKEIQRCYDIGGCEENGKRYLQSVEKRGDALCCGIICNDTAPADFETRGPYIEGYRCDPDAGYMACAQQNCPCGEVSIAAGDYCVSGVRVNPFPDEADEADDKQNEDEESGDAKCNGKDEDNYTEFECLDIYYPGTGATTEYYHYCTKPGGCTTKDGRHYRRFSRALEDEDKLDICSYYLTGTTDNTKETLCRSGDCVIPEDKDLDMIQTQINIFVKKIPSGYIFDNGGDESKTYEGNEDAEEYTTYGVPVLGFVPDTRTCAGGTRYCHGQSHAPIPAPANPKGYICKETRYIPGIAQKDNLKAWYCSEETCECGGQSCPRGAYCHNEKCLCGQQNISGTNFGCLGYTQEAPCRGENCPCGSGNCRHDQFCTRNKCVCGSDIPKPVGEGWECHIDQSFYITNRNIQWQCTTKDGCSGCGDQHCPYNSQCESGRCTCNGIVMPGQNYACIMDNYYPTWVCAGEGPCSCFGSAVSPGQKCNPLQCPPQAVLTPEGCICGNEKMPAKGYDCLEQEPSQNPAIVCSVSGGCECGDEHCEYGMFCQKDHCSIPRLGIYPAALDYWSEQFKKQSDKAKYCEDPNGCPCQDSICRQHTYCVDNTCKPGPISYSIPTSSGPHIQSYDDYYFTASDISRVLQEALLCTEAPPQFTVNFEKSDHFNDYVCEFTSDCEQEYGSYPYRPTGLYCTRPDFCMCGSYRCPAGAECLCNAENQQNESIIRCECKSPEAVQVHPDNSLSCGPSRIPEAQASEYSCMNQLGMTCQKTEGCQCGGIQCSKGSVCLGPNRCTAITVK